MSWETTKSDFDIVQIAYLSCNFASVETAEWVVLSLGHPGIDGLTTPTFRWDSMDRSTVTDA